MLSYLDFINENTNDVVKHNLDNDTKMDVIEHFGSPEQWVKSVSADLNLKSGDIYYDSSSFVIYATLKDGSKIEIEQDGDYVYYGIGDPKFTDSVIKIDGVDFYDIIEKDALKKGYIDKTLTLDLSRTDLYSDIFHSTKEERANIFKGTKSIKKYNL